MATPTGLNYSTYIAELAILSQFNAADPEFTGNIQSALNYAQNRIHRELNLVNDTFSNSTLTLTPSNPNLNIVSAAIDSLYDVNIITPFGAASPNAGTRNPCTIATKEYILATYGSSAVIGVPINFAVFTPNALLFGPWPDQAYMVELIGVNWPEQLSAANPSTWVATYIPDLLLAASMIWMAGFQKNFGAQSDDPRSAMSWETQYSTLRDSAAVADARRKFQSTGWTSELPSRAASPRT
jgi:hypothetical protein